MNDERRYTLDGLRIDSARQELTYTRFFEVAGRAPDHDAGITVTEPDDILAGPLQLKKAKTADGVDHDVVPVFFGELGESGQILPVHQIEQDVGARPVVEPGQGHRGVPPHVDGRVVERDAQIVYDVGILESPEDVGGRDPHP